MRLTPAAVREMLEAAPKYERRCECEPCDRLRIAAPDIARAYLDASAEIDALRAAAAAYMSAADEWDGLRDWSPCTEREEADRKLADVEEALEALCRPDGRHEPSEDAAAGHRVGDVWLDARGGRWVVHHAANGWVGAHRDDDSNGGSWAAAVIGSDPPNGWRRGRQ